MYCSECGNSLSTNDKFCSKCGTKANSTKQTFPKNRFNLLQGLVTQNDYYKAFHTDYLQRYEDKGFLANGMPEDTKEFILNRDYKELVNIPLNGTIIGKLSEEKQEQFIKNSIPVIDDIITDLIIAGYLLRGNFQNVNEHTNFSELSSFKSPKTVLKYLLSVDSPEMHIMGGDDMGFKLSPILTGLAGVSVLDTVEKNLHKLYPPSKALDKSVLIFFMNIGWHLARFDIGRNLK